MVIYPIRDNVDPECRQLVNWVAEIETPQHCSRDWNRLRYAILREVFLRTGDQPFRSIEDVISNTELAALSNSYKRVARFELAAR